jgi:ribosomal protein S2
MQQPTKAHFDQTHSKTHCRYVMYMYQNKHGTQLIGLKKIESKFGTCYDMVQT